MAKYVKLAVWGALALLAYLLGGALLGTILLLTGTLLLGGGDGAHIIGITGTVIGSAAAGTMMLWRGWWESTTK